MVPQALHLRNAHYQFPKSLLPNNIHVERDATALKKSTFVLLRLIDPGARKIQHVVDHSFQSWCFLITTKHCRNSKKEDSTRGLQSLGNLLHNLSYLLGHYLSLLHWFSRFAFVVLRCVTVCCGVLRCVAACCSVLQCVAVCCSVLQREPALCPPNWFNTIG